jgi:hypothetical protein
VSDRAFELLLATVLAIAWTVEFVSARLMSPTLRLIGNPAIARFGWRFAALGAVIPLLPFYNPILGVMMLGPSLLLAANNLDRLWLGRTVGEARLKALLEEAAQTRRLGLAVSSFLGTGLLIAVSGAALMFLSSQRQGDWSYWFGLGLVFYGIAAGLMRTGYAVRLHRAQDVITRAR